MAYSGRPVAIVNGRLRLGTWKPFEEHTQQSYFSRASLAFVLADTESFRRNPQPSTANAPSPTSVGARHPTLASCEVLGLKKACYTRQHDIVTRWAYMVTNKDGGLLSPWLRIP